MAFGTTYANSILDTDLATAYISLHSGDPGSTGANELAAANGYARQLCAFDAASAKATANTAEETFTASGADWSQATHWGVWSAVSGGTFYYGGTISSPRTVADGETATLAAGALTITIA